MAVKLPFIGIQSVNFSTTKKPKVAQTVAVYHFSGGIFNQFPNQQSINKSNSRVVNIYDNMSLSTLTQHPPKSPGST